MPIEIVDSPLKVGRPARARYRAVEANGERFKVRIVDAESPTFAADFEAAFKANVRRIRRLDRLVKSGGVTMSVRAGLKPRLWIVAGPNGCGKSSAYDRSDVDEFGGSVWIINPDLLTARIRDVEHLSQRDANLASVVRIETWLDASLAAYQTIGVETVLSTGKYRRLVEKAKSIGFEFRLIYVFVRSVELQLQRIRLRVAKGGHDVPEDKVRARRERSFDQLPWFFQEADSAWILDNSSAEPELVGRKEGDRTTLSNRLPQDLLLRLTGAGAGN